MKLLLEQSAKLEFVNTDEVKIMYAIIILAEQQLKKQHSLEKGNIKTNGFVADKKKIEDMIKILLELNRY